jgi:hypothetical protein
MVLSEFANPPVLWWTGASLGKPGGGEGQSVQPIALGHKGQGGGPWELGVGWGYNLFLPRGAGVTRVCRMKMKPGPPGREGRT